MAASWMQLNSEMAVEIKGVCKSYKSCFRNPETVISDVNIRVPTGAIYGLLGPSGCGKTTLLRCIVGSLKVDKGSITILGRSTDNLESGVRGPMLGYMPQEVALFKELTIGETLRYFGRILRMQPFKVRKRTDFIIGLLHLPEETRLVRSLSGGQQRRLSLACALFHEPQLLILDEPTVGVDPVLRTSIWEHLLTLANTTNSTIIITTHYIEEANNANLVGMMRNGRLLVQAPPKQLLRRHRMTSLEDVFLHLCCIDDDIQEANVRSQASSSLDWNNPLFQSDEDTATKKGFASSIPNILANVCPNFQRISAIFLKNFTRLRRNPGLAVFQFIIPVVQIIVFALAINGNPHGLRVNYVNDDIGHLGDLFLEHINNYTLSLKKYSLISDAENSVRHGDAWATISIRENFSNALILRYEDGVFTDSVTLEQSEIIVNMDMTNLQISYTLSTELLNAFQTFAADALQISGLNSNISNVPIAFKNPIYGNSKPTIFEFMAPGIILSITYFVAVGLTALAFVLERKDGLLDRSWVAGVTASEVLLSHTAIQGLVMVIQVGLLLVFAICIFNVPCKGPLIIVVLLILLQGFCGMSFGLVVSAICANENSATMFSLGTFYPHLLLSGIVWPHQAMPLWLRYISYVLPLTHSADAARSIMSRGWSIQYETVWLAFVVSGAWIIVLFVLSAIILHLRK